MYKKHPLLEYFKTRKLHTKSETKMENLELTMLDLALIFNNKKNCVAYIRTYTLLNIACNISYAFSHPSHLLLLCESSLTTMDNIIKQNESFHPIT